LFSCLKQFIISKNHKGNRLDKYLIEELKEKSRSSIQNSIISGEILVNDICVKTGYKLKKNDRITINIINHRPEKIQSENIPLNIIYEDDNLIVINKPAGMIVHPGAGNKSGTLVNALLYHCKKLSMLSGKLRPGIVHRLDKDTSGLLVVAKDDKTHRKLQKQFLTKEIRRIYYALIWGVPMQKEGEIKTFITRSRKNRKKMIASYSQGKGAVTNYKLLKDFQYISLLELQLSTGRTHQIRVHLNHINMPVFGDPVYNGRQSQIRRLPSHLQKRGVALLKEINRQSLHAKELSFIHPIKQERMEFSSDLPKDMNCIINKIEDVLLLNEVNNK
jgi:23S rRNA pseudouridine1911/1915/1917 synthase